jgi:tRNA pseudouridine38-40 synthase
MRVRAVVAYDGTGYSGYQRQANAPTVQEALEMAIMKVTREPSTVTAAGRTDAGVHAEGQVIAFDTGWTHRPDDLQRALNAVLPADVAVRELEEASPGFHPRYDARSRWYRYTVCTAAVRQPLARLYSLHVAAPLDVARMAAEARSLVGEHDFATFGQPPSGDSTVRRVLRADWREERSWLTFDIEANAFLYRMVRSVVGTLLAIGRGMLGEGSLAQLLVARDRGQAGPTAPPHGLCLMAVAY